MIELPIQYSELATIYSRTVGRGTRVLSVVAAESGEGVTTLALALARRSAAANRRTMLVDLNLHRPAIARQLGLPDSDWSPEDETPVGVDVAAIRGSLSVLTTPQSRTSAMAWRDGDLLRRCVEFWRRSYDVVIIDTSALNATNRNNVPADIVAASTDASILVAQAGRAREETLRAAIARLDGAGARLVGCVFNDKVNPGLADELIRETRRLDGILPGVARWLRKRIDQSAFLQTEV